MNDAQELQQELARTIGIHLSDAEAAILNEQYVVTHRHFLRQWRSNIEQDERFARLNVDGIADVRRNAPLAILQGELNTAHHLLGYMLDDDEPNQSAVFSHLPR